MHVIFYGIGGLSFAVGGYLTVYPMIWSGPERWWIVAGLALSGLLWLAIGRALSLLQIIADKR